jgi:5'(3')-deoxyribonucleotidase
MRILIDLDGTTADLYAGVEELYGVKLYPWPESNLGKSWISDLIPGVTAERFWDDVKGVDFWANLKPYPYAFELLNFCEEMVGLENIAFLTKTTLDPYCSAGKIMWIRKHFPRYSKQILTACCSKAFCASHQSVLIDDDDTNIADFEKAGGYGLLFPQPWNSARKFDLESVYQELRSYELYIPALTAHRMATDGEPQ